MSLVEYGSSDEELDETNEISTVKQPCSVKHETESKHKLSSLFANLPKPKYSNASSSDIVEGNSVKDVTRTTDLSAVCGKKKQPVKIFVPNLSEFDEDDIPRKRQKSQASSGLMDILPAPKNTILGNAANKLVPHVLTKKPVKAPTVSGATKPLQSTQKNNKNLAMTLVEYDDKDSDDEGNETNNNNDFFSLSSNETYTADGINHVLNDNAASHVLNANCGTYDVTANFGTSAPGGYNNVNISGEILGSNQSNLPEMCKATTATNTTFDSADAAAKEVSSSIVQCVPNEEYSSSPVGLEQNMVYDINVSNTKPQQICEEYDVVHPSQQHKSFLPMPEPQQSIGPVQATNEIDITDERFLRLQGKKERGKEDIQIIDISADQQLPGINTALVKSLTEEVSYKPSRRKGEMPTSQQRRKHQITYLAFQAKERELELKNQWSSNRMTRRQTQAKYGF